MITLITGVPGSGKTAHIVEMILAELQQQRRIYVRGIPALCAQHVIPDPDAPNGEIVFACEEAGNPLTWQRGTWLNIDTYEPSELSSDEFDLAEEDDSNWKSNGNGCTDKGALVIIDEAQAFFRPRSTSSKVPDYIAAFEVHRHQGLDFWLLTQRPTLLDSNLRGLVSRHIHIHTTSMGRRRLEWAEAQDPNNRSSRSMASRSYYKPNPKVFNLYKSAEEHTKIKIRKPNAFYVLIVLVFALISAVVFMKSHFENKLVPKANATISDSRPGTGNASLPVPRLDAPAPTLEANPQVDPLQEFYTFRVAGRFDRGHGVDHYLETTVKGKTYFFTVPFSVVSVINNQYTYQGKELFIGHNVLLKPDNYLPLPRKLKEVENPRSSEAGFRPFNL